MKIVIPVLCSLICFQAHAQTEYAQAHIVQIGILEKANISWNFGENKEDTVNAYKAYKLKNIINAIQLMERKGWELLSINSHGSGNGVTITTANFRRKKKGEQM